MTAAAPKIQLRDVTKTYAELTAVDDLSITIKENELVCFLGPSGSGKTTTLNLIAGLEEPTTGEVLFDGTRVTDVPARERDVAMVFQNLALFERMTVRENLGFAPRVNGASAADVEATVERVADVVGLPTGDFDRSVSDLAASKRQRVALGRAIAAEPDILLLDEPMGDLDRESALNLRGEIKRLRDRIGQTMIYVTHDQEEAMSLADRIMVIHRGRLQQFGTPQELYEQPANRFVAGFIGSPNMNFLEGTLSNGRLDVLDASIPTNVLEERFDDFDPGAFPGSATIGVRPEHVVYAPDNTDIQLELRFDRKEPLGDKTIVYAESDQGEVRIVTRRRPPLRSGDTFVVGADYADIYLIEPESEKVVY